MSTLVIGAGPAGLAVAAALRARGVEATVLERADDVAASWRGHYDRLHLHTTRRWSSLPGTVIPRRYGRWVARDDVVAYLEAYAADLDVRTGVAVERADADGAGWVLTTSAGELRARNVVVATGYNHTPVPPAWPGIETFTGEVLHASRYRNPAPFVGRDVLVVGVGNTGAELAVDLAEGGASRVRLAVRTPPHIVRRSNLGWPAQGTGILVRHLPVPLVDKIAGAVARVEVPDLSSYGLPRPTTGLYSRVQQGSVPVQDVGLIAAVQSGAVTPVAAVVGVDGPDVLLADGSRVSPDVLLAATGYRRGLEPLVGHLGVLDATGVPLTHGPRPARPGLYFTGYTNPISGMFRELRIDAERIARAVV
ncbi:flavin-containing monooxygenase [Cellulomonas rhizosphaerae]|uniref:NAD(P)/FAD-dependent oxidoreductase n=1 Tax=Cellulomonas rhizosphaerae TaxID=2293719 RepID=A0A413RIK5_9CELL|nr:NAD(P)/FAD-dependent oxidoreductase [Cellulomonas rhizosphaerae]RHA38194.1 NAD(P)/FAD-dependent oxidoreductase [Cellulomonas rhizosphaerae]